MNGAVGHLLEVASWQRVHAATHGFHLCGLDAISNLPEVLRVRWVIPTNLR